MVSKGVLLCAVVATAVLATAALAQEIPEPPQFETPVVFQDDFEANTDPEPPAPRIEFVTDTILFFEQPGDALPLAVRVYDENGNLDPEPNLTWSSEAPFLTGLSINGPFTAEATAQQTWPGIVELIVEDSETGARASASAYFVERAEPARQQSESTVSSSRGSTIPTRAHPDAIFINSSDLIGWSGRSRFEQHWLHLRRNPVTESISVGSFVVSGNQAGILVELLQVEIMDEEVRLLAKPAALNAVFESVVFEDSVSTFGATAAATSSATADHESLRGSALSGNTGVAPNARLGGSLECEGEGSSNITLVDAGFEPSLVFRSKINIQDWNLKLAEFRVEASLGATLDVQLMIENTLGAECSIELDQIGFPRLRFGPAISIKPGLAPKIVLSGETSLQVQGPSEWTLGNLAPTWSFNGGLRNEGKGWVLFRNDDPPSATPQPESLVISGSGELELDGTFELPLKTEFCLGWCLSFGILGELNLFKAEIGADYAVLFASPFDKSLPSYSGPQIDSGIDGLAALDISLREEGWVKYLPVSTGFEYSVELFDSRWHLLQTPTLTQELDCAIDCEFEQGEQAAVQLVLDAGANGSGTAEFWAERDGGKKMELLADVPFSGSNGTAQATIDVSALEAGAYKVYPRLWLDDPAYWFWTETFPLGTDESFVAPAFVVNDDGILRVTNGDDAGEGSLRWAVNRANQSENDVEIKISNDVNEISLTSGSITLGDGDATTGKRITIQGHGSMPRISGQNAFRLFRNTDATTEMLFSDLILENGLSEGDGGFGFCYQPGNGGAICAHGTLIIRRCILRSNRSSGFGGAISSIGNFRMRFSTVRNNSAEAMGGGVFASSDWLQGESVEIENSIIADNSCVSTNCMGGGLAFGGSRMVADIERTEISGNSVQASEGGGGGGLSAAVLQINIFATTISGNTVNAPLTTQDSVKSGGAISYQGNTDGTISRSNRGLNIDSSTISMNSHIGADSEMGSGGIIVSDDSFNPGFELSISNSIISGNDNGQGDIGFRFGRLPNMDLQNSLIGNVSEQIESHGDSTTIFGQEPGLQVLTDNGCAAESPARCSKTHGLEMSSIAIDAGTDTRADQRLLPRSGQPPDIGAFERQN